MGACADALRELRGIDERLSSGMSLEEQQASVVWLVQNSRCPALSALAGHVQHDDPAKVLVAWRTLVVDGLEPLEPTLPKVAAIYAQGSGGMVQVVCTSQPLGCGPASITIDRWIYHARRVVAVLIARVESLAKTEPKTIPGATRTQVVLWEGAEHSETNIRLARTRSAYMEAHGNVLAALKAMEQAGDPVGRSTFYNHLNRLDEADPGWRAPFQVSNLAGNRDGMREVGVRRKTRGKVG